MKTIGQLISIEHPQNIKSPPFQSGDECVAVISIIFHTEKGERGAELRIPGTVWIINNNPVVNLAMSGEFRVGQQVTIEIS